MFFNLFKMLRVNVKNIFVKVSGNRADIYAIMALGVAGSTYIPHILSVDNEYKGIKVKYLKAMTELAQMGIEEFGSKKAGGNGEAENGELGKEKRPPSSTGRGYEVKREGVGQGNCGTAGAEITPPAAEDKSPVSISKVLKPAEGEKYYDGGGLSCHVNAPKIEDSSQFPVFGAK